MSDYRIVFNPRSAEYRIERRTLWGWSFLMDGGGRDYLTFSDREAACRHLCRLRGQGGEGHRRWHVLGPCPCPRPAG